MYQLVCAVMAVALTAIVVAGGSTFMRNDMGVRRITTEQIYIAYRAFDSAVSAYRISNNGAMPIPSTSPASNIAAAPWWQLRPYLAGEVQAASVNGVMSAPKGMDWYYTPDSSGAAWLCLQTTGDGAEVPEAIRGAIVKVSERVPSATISKTCDSPGTPPTPTRVALRLMTQSTGQ